MIEPKRLAFGHIFAVIGLSLIAACSSEEVPIVVPSNGDASDQPEAESAPLQATDVSTTRDEAEPVVGPADGILIQVVDANGNGVADADVLWRHFPRSTHHFATEPGEPPHVRASLDSSWRRAATTTDSLGRLRVERFSRNQTVAIAAGQVPNYSFTVVEWDPDSNEVEIALVEFVADGAITGVVLDPEGEPVFDAMVKFGWKTKRSTHTRSTSTGPRGHFALVPDDPDAVGVLEAYVFGGPERSAILGDVRPGRSGLRLELGAPRNMTAEIHYPDGTIEHAAPSVYQARDGRPKSTRGKNQSIPKGHVSLPDGQVTVTVRRKGYVVQKIGPVDSRTLPETWVVHLVELPRATISGRVTFEGEGVGGARVEYRLDAPSDTQHGRGSYGRNLDAQAGATTRADGTYEIVLLERQLQSIRPGWMYAFKNRMGEGHGGSIESLQFGDHAAQDIELNVATGTVLGEVLIPDGESFKHLAVQRIGDPSFRRLTDEGTFLIEGLPSGILELRLVDVRGVATGWWPLPDSDVDRSEIRGWSYPDNSPYSSGLSRSPSLPAWVDADLTHSCMVVPGESTFLQIDTKNEAPFRITGGIRMDGSVPPGIDSSFPGGRMSYFGFGGGSKARLIDLEHHIVVSEVTPDEDGRFVLPAHHGGKYRLELEFGVDAGTDRTRENGIETVTRKTPTQWTVRDVVELVPGDLDWRVDIQTGSLHVVSPKIKDYRDRKTLTVHWVGAGDLGVTVSAGAQRGADSKVFPKVPVGEVRYHVNDDDGIPVAVKKGEVTELDLMSDD